MGVEIGETDLSVYPLANAQDGAVAEVDETSSENLTKISEEQKELAVL